jgi:hypothetical protein
LSEGIWEPFHRIASLALGPDALADLDAFDGGIVAMALALYLGLSSLFGLVFSGLVVEFSRESAPWVGAAAGIVLYLVNYYGFTGLYPWMIEARGPVTLLSHALFGGLFASCYWALHVDRPEARRLASG